MSLRRRTYLVEATYERDRAVRRTAIMFYSFLRKFLKGRSDELDYDPEKGTFAVMASRFWDDHRARNLAVLFTSNQSSAKGWKMQGGIGTAGNLKVLVFPILLAPGDKRHLATRLNRDLVVHEVVHYLDPGTFKQRKSSSYKAIGGKVPNMSKSGYYNDPGEWNAYWQEGATKAEQLIRTDVFKGPGPHGASQKKAMNIFYGDGSLKQFRARVDKFWSKDFLQSMSPKTRRKFDKRLAQLWTAFKKKGWL